MIRVAAVGDVHFGEDSAGLLSPHLENIHERADVLLLAGDLTRSGFASEAQVLANELKKVAIPKVAVLGNHDYHQGEEAQVTRTLEESGVRVLERDCEVLELEDCTVAVIGMKGFGGGFAGACATDFGEPEMKAFIGHTKMLAAKLETVLDSAAADRRIVLLHYSPVKATLMGERLEIYPFLGSYLLAEAIDRAGADLIFHGHAHGGREKGVTPGGVHVRNVAQPVIKHAYNVYRLD